MWCFYSEDIYASRLFILRYGVLAKSEKKKKTQLFGINFFFCIFPLGKKIRRKRFGKCEFELLRCENIMRFLILPMNSYTTSYIFFFLAITFSFLLLLQLPRPRFCLMLFKHVEEKYELQRSLPQTHTKSKNEEKHEKQKFPFILFPDKIDFYFISAFLLKHNKGG